MLLLMTSTYTQFYQGQPNVPPRKRTKFPTQSRFLPLMFFLVQVFLKEVWTLNINKNYCLNV